MKFLSYLGNSGESRGHQALDRAIRATRQTDDEAALSAPARARILDAVQHQAEHPVELFPALFTAPRRLIVAGVLPLLLAAGLLVTLNQSTTTAPDHGSSTLRAVKQGGQVFFEIANGSRSHVVYRSTVPDRFDTASGVRVTEGAFAAPLDERADLVFYRVD